MFPTNIKILLLGGFLILMSIACNVMQAGISQFWMTINHFVGNYGHWIGFLLVLAGIFIPNE